MIAIRNYTRSDAPNLARLLHASIHVIGARDYSEDQLNAQSPKPMTGAAFHERVSDGRYAFVAIESSGSLSGFIELDASGYIDCFYCRADTVGTGVGKALYRHLHAFALDLGMTTITVDASEAAKRFFLRMGFRVEKRRVFILRGLEIHNYAMRLDVGSSADIISKRCYRFQFLNLCCT